MVDASSGLSNGHLPAPSVAPTEPVTVDNLEVVDGRVDLSAVHALPCSSFKGSETIVNEPALYEKFFLDDFDNYWDEINDRLTVSRMVSDSVIKGMVRAVVEESAEKITSKEAQIANLNEKLQLYDSKAASGVEFMKLPLTQCYLDSSGDTKNLDLIKDTVEQQILMLKEDIQNIKVSTSHSRVNGIADGLCSVPSQEKTSEQLMGIDVRVDAVREVVGAAFEEIKGMFSSLKASALEEQWEFGFEREINSIIVQSHVRDLQAEFERKLYEQRDLVNMLSTNWQQKVTELSIMREELDNITKSFLSSESSLLISHKSYESLEETNSANKNDLFPRTVSGSAQFPYTTHIEENGNGLIKKAKDISQPMLDVVVASQLSHLSKEELVTYYKTEVLKMRRHHESALQEKTEELFRLKREFLKEKGSPLRREKEFEMLKKKIPEVILKLDDILLEKEALPRIETSYDESCSLKDKISALLSQNKHLQGLLTEKREEVKCLSAQISDAANLMSRHSSAETIFLAQINKLRGDLEDTRIETSIRCDMFTIIYKEVLGEYMRGKENIEVEIIELMQEIYTTIIGGIIGDAVSAGHSKSSLEALLSEKEKLLSIEIEENGKLKEAVISLSTLLKEKETFASETDSVLTQYKEQFDLLSEKLKLLREQVIKQEKLIQKNEMDSDLLKRRLEDSLQQNHQNEVEINKLKGELVIVSDALKEAEKQKTVLRIIVEEKEKKISSSTKDNLEAKQMHSIIVSMMELSEAFVALENNLTKRIERYETRMKNVSHEMSPLLQHTKQLVKKGQFYKQMLDIRYSNLQKAEAEVDLLGDEVDALLSLLEKIYIALDHYSPVLQLYPGVMEILKLVRRELEGGTTRTT